MKKMKRIGCVALIYLVLMGIGFLAGNLYQQKNGGTLDISGPGLLVTPPGVENTAGAAVAALGGGTQGLVKSIDGNKVTISTAQDASTIILTDATTLVKTTTGASTDIKIGDKITVMGQSDANGVITASQITIGSSAVGIGSVNSVTPAP